MAVPRINLIRVLRYAMTFHLPMRRHADGLPATHIIIRLFKPLRTCSKVARIMEIPETVEAAAQRRDAAGKLQRIGISDVVAVCRQAVLGKIRWIG